MDKGPDCRAVGPHRKTPELFSQDICLESIPDQPGGSFQVLGNIAFLPFAAVGPVSNEEL